MSSHQEDTMYEIHTKVTESGLWDKFSAQLKKMQNQIIIYAVLIYTLLNALLLIVRNVNDILGFTSKFELLVIIQTIFFSVSILSSFYLNQLNINSYIIISCLSFLFIIISGTILFIKKSNIILNLIFMVERLIVTRFIMIPHQPLQYFP